MSRLTDDKKTLALVTTSMASMDLSAEDDVRVMGLVNMAYETAWIRSENVIRKAQKIAREGTVAPNHIELYEVFTAGKTRPMVWTELTPDSGYKTTGRRATATIHEDKS